MSPGSSNERSLWAAGLLLAVVGAIAIALAVATMPQFQLDDPFGIKFGGSSQGTVVGLSELGGRNRH